MKNQGINILKAILLGGVILIHCNLNNYISLPSPGKEIINFISQDLCSVAVPGFFMISGYLFFLNINEFTPAIYRKKLSSRIKTLLIPYLLWNIIAAATDLVKGLVFNIPTPGFVEGGNIHWTGFFTGFWSIYEGRPLAFAFWFIRNLMVFTIITPIIWVIVKHRILFFLSLLALLLSGWGWGIVYFITGAYIANSHLTLPKLKTSGTLVTLSVYFLLAFVKHSRITDSLPIDLSSTLLWTMTLAALTGMFSISNYLSSPSQKPSLRNTLLANTFFIYAFHQLYCSVNCKAWLWLLPPPVSKLSGTITALADYGMTFLTFVVLSLTIGVLLQRLLPNAYNILTGGRSGTSKINQPYTP